MLSNKGTCVAACISPKTARLFQASLLHRSTPRPGLTQKPREQCFPLPRKAAKPGLRAGPGPPQRPAFSSLLCRLVLLRGKWEQEPPPTPPTLALVQCTSVAPGAARGRPGAHLLLGCSAELPASGAMAPPRGLGKMGPVYLLSVGVLSQLLGRPGSRTLVALSIHDLLPKDRGQDLTPLSLWPLRGQSAVLRGHHGSRGPLLPPSLRTGT